MYFYLNKKVYFYNMSNKTKNINNFKKYNDKGLSGIVNLGNTCYINSAIQCLSHTLELTDFFLNTNWESIYNDSKYKHKQFSKQWYRLLNGLWEDNCTISPNSLFKLMIKISNEDNLTFGFSSYKQNDIQEFIIFVLDLLHESLGESLNYIPKENSLESFYKNKYSKIIELFYGQIETIILDINTNKKLSNSFQPICIFSLPIPKNKDNINVKDCLELYLKEELLDGENKWFNPKTKDYTIVNKRTKIVVYPQILILCFNRFDNKSNKITCDIEVSDLNIDKNKYSLYGICNHFGSSLGGHYYSYCKNNNNWYKFNDNIVTKLESINLNSANNYCLFYRKK